MLMPFDSSVHLQVCAILICRYTGLLVAALTVKSLVVIAIVLTLHLVLNHFGEHSERQERQRDRERLNAVVCKSWDKAISQNTLELEH